MSVDNPTLRWVGILIGFLFIAAALAACSGESSGSDAPRDEPQSQETAIPRCLRFITPLPKRHKPLNHSCQRARSKARRQ